jgi:predicted ester cyclase
VTCGPSHAGQKCATDQLVTTYKTYDGTRTVPILGIASTGRTVKFETVDVMKVVDGKITED